MPLTTRVSVCGIVCLSLSPVYAWLRDLPPQAMMVDPLDVAVMGPNATFREDTTAEVFNPTNTTPPFFRVFNGAFLGIMGPNASIRAVAANPTFAFAHEAPIWDPKTDEVFFCSNDGGALGHSDINTNTQILKISLVDVANTIDAANSSTAAVNVTVTSLDLPDTIQMDNGGIGPFRDDLLLATSGRGPLLPSIVRVNPAPPHNATVLLDNFLGRQFNSLNDIKVHPTSGAIFFTDDSYGKRSRRYGHVHLRTRRTRQS